MLLRQVLLPPPPAGVLLPPPSMLIPPPPPARPFPPAAIAPLFFTSAQLLLPTLPPLPTFESSNCSESTSSPSCSGSRSCSASTSSPSSSSNAAIEGGGLRFGLAPPPCVTVGVLKRGVWDRCECGWNERGSARAVETVTAPSPESAIAIARAARNLPLRHDV